MPTHRVQLTSRTETESNLPNHERSIAISGFEAHRVTLTPAAEFDYHWPGSSHYLAMHSLELNDGELFCDNKRHLGRDLRGSLSFFPAGVEVIGWSVLNRAPQSYTALYFNKDQINTEFETRLFKADLRPGIYFSSSPLKVTFAKINEALLDPHLIDTLYIQHLMLTGIVELCRHQEPKLNYSSAAAMSVRQKTLLIEYIESSLHMDLTLDDLAKLLCLSRFHFTRVFKKTFGTTPYQYVLWRRCERIKDYLAKERAEPIPYLSFGFKSPAQMARSFKNVTGVTLSEFKRLIS